MKEKKPLIIWGATGQSIVLEELLKDEYNIHAVIDNNKNINSPFENIPIYYGEQGFYELYSDSKANYNFIVAIGGTRGKDRVEISKFLLQNQLQPISAIHKSSYIASNVTLGIGVQVMMGACVAAKCSIGDYVIINTSASVDHECHIGNGCHIGPGAILAGNVRVNMYSFIGAGTTILPNINIGKQCIIGAGSVVTKDVPDYSVVYGNPAKIKVTINE